MEVNLRQAKIRLSRLLAQVAEGEEVIITKSGIPVAKLVPITGKRRKRALGSAKGEFMVPDGFNDPLSKEIEDLFYK